MIKRPGTIVFLLTGLNLLNYLDRLLFAAVSPSIKNDFSLSDFQVGIATQAFLFGYMLTSPFFGRLGDVMPRKWLIALGVGVWCGATAASGLVGSFVALVAVRGIVGIGEASYAALSPTIIDDITPQAKKGRVLAIFFSAIPIGSALGFIVGGLLDKHFGWRHAFLAVGAPGMLLVVLCMLMVEPKRATAGDHPQVPLGRAVKELLSSRMYVWAVLGFVAQTAVVGGFASWAPHYLVRKFHMDLAEANTYFGGVVVLTGFVGTFLGGFLNDRIKDASPMRASMRVNAYSAVIAVPCCAICVVAPSPVLFFAAITLAQIAIWTSLSPLNAVLLGSVPNETRALAMAMSIFAGHAFGDVPAVPLIGLLSDTLGSLPNAMLVLPFLMVACAAAWWVGMNAKPTGPAADAAAGT